MCHVNQMDPPHILTCLICGELHILSAKEQFLSTQCCCHSGLCHTGSHHIIIFIIDFISLLLLSLRKNKLNFFMLSLCQFSDYVPWLPRVVFQLSPEHLLLFCDLSRASSSILPDHPLLRFSLLLRREPFDLSGLDQNSPLVLQKKSS
jgi:hypothetical protein